jgi:hypothetical protein
MTDMDFTARGLVRKLDADLASQEPGKGASLIGVEDGQTVQARFDQMKVGTLAELESQAVTQGDVVELTDSSRSGSFSARPASGLNPALVAADTVGGIYKPSASNSAYVWVRRMERIKPEFFGDISDPDTAHIALDKWAEMGGLDKYVMLVDREYRFKQGIWLPDNCVIEMTADGWLHNVRTTADGGNSQEKGALQIGRMHPVWLPFETGNDGGTGSWTAAFEWNDVGDIATGAPVIFDTPSDMDDYTDRQVVLVASGAYSSNGNATPGSNWFPHQLVATVMIKGTSGQWRSLYPLPAMTNPKVTNLVTATTDSTWDSRTPQIASNVRIYGGKVSSDEGQIFTKTGMLGCDIHLAEADGAYIIFNNANFFSNFEIDRAHATQVLCEVACGSHASTYLFNSATFEDHGAAGKCVRIGENATDIKLTLRHTNLHGTTGSASLDALIVNAGRRNTIRWESGRLTGNWLAMMKCNDQPASDSADGNATVSLCDENRIDVDERVDCSNGAVSRVIWDASSYDYAADSLNATRDNRYSGAPNITASGDAVRAEGYRMKLGGARPLKLLGGDINLISTSDGGHEIDVEGPFTWTAHLRDKIAKLRIDGFDQLAAPQSETSPTDASVAYSVDFSKRHHKVSLADAGISAFAFNTFSNYISGGRCWIEIDNTSGASITPTVNPTFFKLASGVTLPAVPDDDVLLVEMLALKNSVGNNRVLILSAAVAG